MDTVKNDILFLEDYRKYLEENDEPSYTTNSLIELILRLLELDNTKILNCNMHNIPKDFTF